MGRSLEKPLAAICDWALEHAEATALGSPS
jgi:hypothetical protein